MSTPSKLTKSINKVFLGPDAAAEQLKGGGPSPGERIGREEECVLGSTHTDIKLSGRTGPNHKKV